MNIREYNEIQSKIKELENEKTYYKIILFEMKGYEVGQENYPKIEEKIKNLELQIEELKNIEEVCPTCMTNKIKDLELKIKELENKNEKLEDAVYKLGKELNECKE
jgi:DNA repair exonuclease SbcCD ATPase subunit